jgi:hypothetical protein
VCERAEREEGLFACVQVCKDIFGSATLEHVELAAFIGMVDGCMD